MKTHVKRIKFLVILLLMAFPVMLFGQGGLLGTWKYVSPQGEMLMQISQGTIVINEQPYAYKAEGNVLMIYEDNKATPYPYMIDGNELTLEFPGGMQIVFIRSTNDPSPKNQLPQSMTKSAGGKGQALQSSTLSGKWLFQNQMGQLTLEFLSGNQLSFNGEDTEYQLKEGIIQAMGDYGWIDYPYTLSGGTLTVTFPDGTRYPFTKISSGQSYQQGTNQGETGTGSAWQLNGTLCSWSGSSNDYSSYSRSQKIAFDGQGHFQVGSESSFSSDAGIAYGGNPNVKTGTYSVGNQSVILYFQDGDRYEFKINMRQDSGIITELMYNGTLYAKALCE